MQRPLQNSTEQLSFRRDLILTALVPLLTMALFLGITLLQLNNRLAANQSVDNDDQTIAQAQWVQTLLVDMETGVRGTLLTGDQTYLQPYQVADPIVDVQLATLKQMTGDSTQQGRVSTVQAQLGSWRQFATAALASTSAPTATEQLRGKAIMDQMRASITDFIDAQRSFRVTHAAASEQISQSTVGLRTIVAVVLAIFLAIFFRNQFSHLSNRFLAALRVAQQKTDEALFQQDLLQGTLASIGDGVIATDNSGNITLINRVARFLTETAQQDAVGKPLSAVFDVLDQDTRMPIQMMGSTNQEIALASAPRQGELSEMLLVGKSGRELPIENNVAPILNSQGLTLGTVFVFRDLSERRRASAQLNSSERRYRDLTNAMPLILWTAKPTGAIDFYNQQWFDYTGLTPAQSQSADAWQAALHPDDAGRTVEEWNRALASGDRYEIEARWKRASDGAYLWHLGRAVPIGDEQGKPSSWVGTLTNIDTQKQSEATLSERTENLELSTQRLEERNQELDQFAYITSHDLKAPLRGIANLSQWIEEDLGENANAEIHQQMELLRGRVHRMEGLIDGILEYSRVGRVKTAVETINVDALLRDILDLIAPPPEIIISVGPGMPTLRAERSPMQQVFSNLIGNAIKHRQKAVGHIEVAVQERSKFYEFSVADDGPGIAQEFHQKIFVIFQTLESRDKVEGSGLGLALVKKIVEQQGGKIWLTSQVGVGTTFFFTWPKVIQER